ncbi:MAG TPA: hypothetical protein PKZ73_05460 [Methanomassiliicoccales archaeon]|nr:hypothetical protein [Methanomassiliicoccales archaeon]
MNGRLSLLTHQDRHAHPGMTTGIGRCTRWSRPAWPSRARPWASDGSGRASFLASRASERSCGVRRSQRRGAGRRSIPRLSSPASSNICVYAPVGRPSEIGSPTIAPVQEAARKARSTQATLSLAG